MVIHKMKMKKLLIFVFIGTLFIACTNKKEDKKEQKKEISNAPIIGDEKQIGKW